MAMSNSRFLPALTPRSSKWTSAMKALQSGRKRRGTISSLRSPVSTKSNSSSRASECSFLQTPSGGCIRSAPPSPVSRKRFSGSQRSTPRAAKSSSVPSGSGLRVKPINHSSRKHHEVLLPMRKDDGGRTALLRYLRQDVRREALPALACEPTRRGGLLEVRQPRALDAPAKGSDESAALGAPRPAWLRALALLCVSESCHRPAPHTGGPAARGGLGNTLVRPLVALVETAGLVSRGHSFFLEKQEAER